MSSVTPSAKNSFSGSLESLVKGRTAIARRSSGGMVNPPASVGALASSLEPQSLMTPLGVRLYAQARPMATGKQQEHQRAVQDPLGRKVAQEGSAAWATPASTIA